MKWIEKVGKDSYIEFEEKDLGSWRANKNLFFLSLAIMGIFVLILTVCVILDLTGLVDIAV
jgi:hypothetical protein